MFSVYNIPDLEQLAIKRQLRNNTSILYLIKGVDNSIEFLNLLKSYSSKCSEIYYNKVIEKPTYDESTEINSIVGNNLSFTKNIIFSHVEAIFSGLSKEHINLISESITEVFNECLLNNVNISKVKNGYIRCLVTLRKRLSKITFNLDGDNRLLYVGKPDKFDILTFTVLGLCGVDVVICDLEEGLTSECLCVNRFLLISGKENNIDLGFLKYSNQGVKDINLNTNTPNEWVNFKEYSELDNILKLVNLKIEDRQDKDRWKVLHIEVQGVNDKQSYGTALETFMMNVTASLRPYVLFDTDISKPSYDEAERYKKNYNNKTVCDIMSEYSLLKNSGSVVQISDCFDKIIKSEKFENERKKDSFITNLMIWFIRYVDLFFKTSFSKLPLLVVYGSLSQKELNLIELLSYLPLDIVVFEPVYSVAYTTVFRNSIFKSIVIGESSSVYEKYPINIGLSNASTVAYNAERELDSILYNDTSLFRIKQFKNINVITLKTTYEEVGILWNEPAKFRPSFESVGNLVTVPTIFTKVNGVNSSYKSDIQKLVTPNTVVLNSFPIQLQPSIIDNNSDLKKFTKQLVFRNSIDFDKLCKSKFYSYGVYSEETQNLIFEKVNKLIAMDWCQNGDKNLVYDILDTVFRLPSNIMQMIHNYDFTAGIPKIIVYNGGSTPCTLTDCIIIMFLKLIGFDVIVFAPTGYRVIEQYIDSSWFNEITIGQFDFNMEYMDFSSSFEGQQNNKKQGFFSRLFN